MFWRDSRHLLTIVEPSSILAVCRSVHQCWRDSWCQEINFIEISLRRRWRMAEERSGALKWIMGGYLGHHDRSDLQHWVLGCLLSLTCHHPACFFQLSKSTICILSCLRTLHPGCSPFLEHLSPLPSSYLWATTKYWCGSLCCHSRFLPKLIYVHMSGDRVSPVAQTTKKSASLRQSFMTCFVSTKFSPSIHLHPHSHSIKLLITQVKICVVCLWVLTVCQILS